MKSVLTAVFLILLLGYAPGGEEGEKKPDAKTPPGPESEFLDHFARNLILAEYLAAYDAAAWVSGDEMLKEPLDVRKKVRTWYAYEGEKAWHVVYGAMDEKREKFTRHVHHLVRSGKEVTKLKDLATKDHDLAVARALDDSSVRLKKLPIARRIAFNPYVVRDEKEIRIWVLPQVTRDWVVVFGNSHRYRYSVDGRKFLEHKAWAYGLDGSRVSKESRDKEVRIGSKDLEYPTVADLFTVIRFERHFKSIQVVSAYGITLRMNGHMWTHLVWPDLGTEPAGEEKETEPGKKEAEPGKKETEPGKKEAEPEKKEAEPKEK